MSSPRKINCDTEPTDTETLSQARPPGAGGGRGPEDRSGIDTDMPNPAHFERTEQKHTPRSRLPRPSALGGSAAPAAAMREAMEKFLTEKNSSSVPMIFSTSWVGSLGGAGLLLPVCPNKQTHIRQMLHQHIEHSCSKLRTPRFMALDMSATCTSARAPLRALITCPTDADTSEKTRVRRALANRPAGKPGGTQNSPHPLSPGAGTEASQWPPQSAVLAAELT